MKRIGKHETSESALVVDWGSCDALCDGSCDYRYNTQYCIYRYTKIVHESLHVTQMEWKNKSKRFCTKSFGRSDSLPPRKTEVDNFKLTGQPHHFWRGDEHFTSFFHKSFGRSALQCNVYKQRSRDGIFRQTLASIYLSLAL